jgi:hypothetical protein
MYPYPEGDHGATPEGIWALSGNASEWAEDHDFDIQSLKCETHRWTEIPLKALANEMFKRVDSRKDGAGELAIETVTASVLAGELEVPDPEQAPPRRAARVRVDFVLRDLAGDLAGGVVHAKQRQRQHQHQT